MCARKVHPHFTIYHLPCNQSRVRVTSELHRSYLGVPPSQDSRGVIFARSWSGKEMFIVNSEKVRIFGYADVTSFRICQKKNFLPYRSTFVTLQS